jgi:uncharacterized protein
MANPLLDRESPQDLATQGQVIEFKGKVADFARLVEIIEADLAATPAASRPVAWRAAPVEIKLEFGWSDDRRETPSLSGRVQAGIAAVCQRCLEPFVFTLETELRLLFMKSPAALRENVSEDIWEVEEETVRPLEIVEESLIMALPLAPMHDPVELCGPLIGELRREADNEPVGSDRPFAELRAQMDELD